MFLLCNTRVWWLQKYLFYETKYHVECYHTIIWFSKEETWIDLIDSSDP